MTATGRLATGLLEAAALTALVAVPLRFEPYSARIFEPDKAGLLGVLAALAVAFAAIRVLAETRHARLLPAAGPTLPRPLALALGAVALATLLASCLSVAPHASFWGSHARAHGAATIAACVAVLLALATTIRSPARLERAVATVVLAGILAALYAVAQLLGGDPQHWDGDVRRRASGTLGNPIFLGGFLAMTMPLTLGTAWNMRARRRAGAITLLAAAAFQSAALVGSASRGPVVASVVAVVFLLALELARRGRRRAVAAALAATLLGGAVLAAAPAYRPAAAGRAAPRSVTTSLDPESPSARVRVLVWQGVARLVSTRDPLILADGRPDPLHALRPLVGHGPETLLFTFPRFRPPELAQLERRDRMPDRAHNAVWDALASGGLLGLATQLGLWFATFHVAFAALGFLPSRRARATFALLVALGVALTAALLVGIAGVAYLGPAVAIGFVGGLFAYLPIAPSRRDPRPPTPSWAPVLAAVVLAHVVEIQVGIATVATELLFFAALGLLAAAAGSGAAPTPVAGGAARSSAVAGGAACVPASGDDARSAVVFGLLLALGLGTLGYGLLGNPGLLTGAGAILVAAARDGTGAVLLAAAAAGGGFAVLAARLPVRTLPRMMLAAAVPTSLLLAWHARALAALAAAAPRTIEDVLASAALIERLPARYYLFVLLVLGALGVALAPPPGQPRRQVSAPVALASVALVGLALGLAERVWLRPLRADLALKSADYLVPRARWREASAFLERALALAPGEAEYWSRAARCRHEEAKAAAADLARRDALAMEALAFAGEAVRREPLHPGHLANVGRIGFWWASVTSDPALRVSRAEEADAAFAAAIARMPSHGRLWAERAALQANLLGRTDLARDYATRAVSLDPTYELARRVLADLDRGAAAANPPP